MYLVVCERKGKQVGGRLLVNHFAVYVWGYKLLAACALHHLLNMWYDTEHFPT